MSTNFLFSRPSRAAINITCTYLGISILWIYFSDQAILFFFQNAEALNRAQTYKGWFFVTVTALVMFFLLQQEIKRHTQTEKALQEGEDRYRALIDLAVDGILLGSHEGFITEANQYMCTMVGTTRENLIGKHISSLPFSQESLEKIPFRFDLLQRGETVRSERALIRPDGSEITIEMRTKMMPDGTYQSIYRDTTERQKTERALQESEEKFALAFEASPDAVNINRLEDGLFVDINKGFTTLTGYTHEDVMGKTSLEIDIWHDHADRQRLTDILKKQGYCENHEATFRRKDGRLATGLISARIIALHNAPHIISITRDITQRKQDEANLERLKVAIEHASEIIIITDAEGNIQYANPAFAKVTGYTFEDVFQQNTRILKSGLHDESFYEELWKTITNGRTWTGRLVNKKNDGTLYTEEATISPVFNSQAKIVNFVAIKRDITEQLKLEAQYQQAQKMESIGRLTGGVAHDFNNILAVILGYTELALAQTESSEKIHFYLKNIEDATIRSTDIVRQLLAFSRKQTIAPKVLDLNKTVAGMLKMLRRLIGEDIDLVWMPASDLAPIKMDPVQIDQILANLCVNARDAIKGAGKIIIATERVHLDENSCALNADFIPGDYVMLSVSDNGCGMEKKIAEQIFEPFFTTKGQLGTGLGLATVYGIVKQNNSFIEVSSKPDNGTTIRIYLPIHTDGPLWREEKESEEPSLNRGETILLVEDDPHILELGFNMLENLGYQVLATDSPSEALRMAEEHTNEIDLLITDVVMPGMNGKELAQQLLARRPELKLLYMSGYTADVIAHHGVLDEGIHFLQKPFTSKELSTKIKEVLDVKNADAQMDGL